jgi:hypothetical protein
MFARSAHRCAPCLFAADAHAAQSAAHQAGLQIEAWRSWGVEDVGGKLESGGIEGGGGRQVLVAERVGVGLGPAASAGLTRAPETLHTPTQTPMHPCREARTGG